MVFPVEIKVNVDASGTDAVAALLPGSAATSQRQIWFAESRDGVESGLLPLLAHHVVVRLRSGGGVDDVTVTLGPCMERQLVGRWMTPFETKSFVYRIQGEWSGACRGLAASAVSRRAQGSLMEVVGVYADPAEAITVKQRQFLNQCAPPSVRVDRLVALGPIATTESTAIPVGGMHVDVSRWTAADLDCLELSTRVEPKDDEPSVDFESRVSAQLRQLEGAVRDLGLPIDTRNDTKTQRVLTALARIRVHQ